LDSLPNNRRYFSHPNNRRADEMEIGTQNSNGKIIYSSDECEDAIGSSNTNEEDIGSSNTNEEDKEEQNETNKKNLNLINLNLYKAKEFTNTSDKSWQIFKNSCANFPSLRYVKEKRIKLNSILPVKLTNDNCGATCDPKEKMEFFLKLFKDKLIIKNNTVNIRLSGDGTEAGRQFSLFNFNFGFIDPVKPGLYEPNQSKNKNKTHLLSGNESILNPNTVTGNFCLGSFNVEGESYEKLKNCLPNLLEILSLINKLEVDGVSYNIEYW